MITRPLKSTVAPLKASLEWCLDLLDVMHRPGAIKIGFGGGIEAKVSKPAKSDLTPLNIKVLRILAFINQAFPKQQAIYKIYRGMAF